MKISGFEWNKKREIAAFSLATGETRKEASVIAGISEKTIYNWLADPEFSAEVDRLSLMIDIASKAERLRLARRVVRQKLDQEVLSDKDLLDWLKFAREEVEGIRLDIDITAILQNVAPVAGSE
jgi:hypothetical protein